MWIKLRVPQHIELGHIWLWVVSGTIATAVDTASSFFGVCCRERIDWHNSHCCRLISNFANVLSNIRTSWAALETVRASVCGVCSVLRS
jgi:hypothetical protein